MTQYNEKLVDRLFVRFSTNYGHLWSSQFRSDDFLKAAKAEWGIKLKSYSMKAIALAVESCFKRYPKAPPSLPNFLMLCDGYTAKDFYKALPKPEPNEELAKKSIAEMVKIVGSRKRRKIPNQDELEYMINRGMMKLKKKYPLPTERLLVLGLYNPEVDECAPQP